ncbi:sugar O-acetyltransferase [Levilactobacillus bambusae]|uniref:sugar O-acetyltransferase n=1 Tax=Levilactobacillus bambusae TaxID=2024736 RepID=UPI0014023B54|nr:sugar O-acetyltransferase [Levilactobacillus bambusae]
MSNRPADPNIEALSKKDIFDRVRDGDWYQFKHEPAMQKIVTESAIQIQKINDVAKTDPDQALTMLHDIVPHLADDVAILFPIATIEHPACLTVGPGTFFNTGLQILSAGQVTIGSNCFIGPNCQLYTPNHHPSDKLLRRDGWQYDLPITIGDDCWFGGSVIVLPGVTLGDNVVVGAGSVITKDVPSDTVVAGNPARPIQHHENSPAS